MLCKVSLVPPLLIVSQTRLFLFHSIDCCQYMLLSAGTKLMQSHPHVQVWYSRNHPAQWVTLHKI